MQIWRREDKQTQDLEELVTSTNDAVVVEITKYLAKEIWCTWWEEGSVHWVLALAWDVGLGDRDFKQLS